MLGKAACRSSEQCAARGSISICLSGSDRAGCGRRRPIIGPARCTAVRSPACVKPLAGSASNGLGRANPKITFQCFARADLIAGEIAAQPGADREFVESYLAPWAKRLLSISNTQNPFNFMLAWAWSGEHSWASKAKATLSRLRACGNPRIEEAKQQEKCNARIRRRLPYLRRHYRRAAAVLDRFLQEPMSVAFAGTQRTNLSSPAVSAEPSR